MHGIYLKNKMQLYNNKPFTQTDQIQELKEEEEP